MDARIVKTKETVQRTIIQLLQSHPLNEISVSTLCKQAGINRNTFYSHYRTPLDVVEEISDNLIDELDRIVKQEANGLTKCTAICQYLYDNRTLFGIVSGANCDYRYFDIVIRRAKENAVQRDSYTKWCDRNELRDSYPDFIMGGFIFVLNRWMENGMQESPEEMGKRLHCIFAKCTM